MITSGIDRIFIGTRDMDESLAFYRDFVKMSVVADQELDSGKITKLWDLPKGTSARAVFLKNEDQPTLLELIQFNTHSGRYIREGARTWDYGIYDIAFTVKDLKKIYIELRDKGFSFITPPTLYSPTLLSGLNVKFSVCIGPDEVPIAHIQPVTPSPPIMKKAYGRLGDSAQMVENMEEALRFYRDLLGLTVIKDATFPKGLYDEILDLPEGTEGRIVILNKVGSKSTFTELVEVSIKGKSLAEVARPPNLGIFMISFETDNLSFLTEKLKKDNFTILAGPIELELIPYGKIRIIEVKGPSKVRIEFFERRS